MATVALLAFKIASPCLLVKSRLSGEGWKTSVMARPDFGSFWAVSSSPRRLLDAEPSCWRLWPGTVPSSPPPGYLADWSLSKPSVLVMVGLSGSSTKGGSGLILF